MCHRAEENHYSKLQGSKVTEARFDEMRTSTKALSTDLRTLKQLQKNDHGYVSRQRPELVLMPNLGFAPTIPSQNVNTQKSVKKLFDAAPRFRLPERYSFFSRPTRELGLSSPWLDSACLADLT